MIEIFAQAPKGNTRGTVDVGGMRLEAKTKVRDSKAYLGSMQMEHGVSKKSCTDIVEEDGELQSDSTLSDLDDAPNKRFKFAIKTGTTERSQIGSGSIDLMLEKLLHLVKSWGDSGQDQGEASDRGRIEAIIASRPK
ncbi:hypothetical protein A4A49_65075 [Nicotiana attenuata]|uniref:Uncharacterized protein n=1 Tax=Nicotiana attenuata TaxID=49451 RepID=A0A314KVA5_NICAT|nr:hypothetical protein A4A49_65075 [Nicotiana attenuata]